MYSSNDLCQKCMKNVFLCDFLPTHMVIKVTHYQLSQTV